MRIHETLLAVAIVAFSSHALVACSAKAGEGEGDPSKVAEDAKGEHERLGALAPDIYPVMPKDVSNKYADDANAALFGQRLFFDVRFSGPLLASEHDGSAFSSGLGVQGMAGRIACASCHVPSRGFVDTRSTKQQVSLGAAWTNRKAPSLVGVGRQSLLMWDGRRDAGYNQVFSPIEASAELNSSRLSVAQQMERWYLSDGRFHNIGLPSSTVSLIISVGGDRGAVDGLPKALTDPLNVKGVFSDGDDGRLTPFASANASSLVGAFKTPSLRCVSRRPSFTHTGQLRSLEEVVSFFNRGGGHEGSGFVGQKEIGPLGLAPAGERALVAFLGTLDGGELSKELLAPPP